VIGERMTGFYVRNFGVPAELDAKPMKARLEGGLLTPVSKGKDRAFVSDAYSR
jgi:HSP20 family molecular chaperone IbpA